MGIFSRVRDIVNSNLNSMLEKAEDPEKLIKLMIMEMEDTLVEVKASAAGIMADAKNTRRALNACQDRASGWADKAQLAMDKDREDLAREALLEKRRFSRQAEGLEQELSDMDALISQYHEDLGLLEAKLVEAQEKHRVLVKRAIRAQDKKKVHSQIRKAASHDAVLRFEQFERRIDRSEAEADLVNMHRKDSLEDRFEAMQVEDDIEREMAAMREGKDAAKKAD
ncbi:MAG: phage shock protein PspA [Deltaproteobacteria bacterium]|nr:phage shock protein PspA [Deltaproteobacteria bacterium]